MVKRTDIAMTYYKMCKNGFMMCLSAILHVGANIIEVHEFVWGLSLVVFIVYLLEFSMNFYDLTEIVRTYKTENE